MAKQVKYGSDVRRDLLSGATKLAQAVTTTLGPKGRNVLIEKGMGAPLITKDGVTVAREFSLEDKYENLAVGVLKQAAIKTNEEAGDGTTTATALSYALVQQGVKLIEAGHDPMEISEGINQTLQQALAIINKTKKPIKSREDIFNVARISANNDDELGNIIADAFSNIGDDGVVTVEHSRGMTTYVDYTEGLEYDKGYMSPFFCNTKDFTVELENCHVLITDQPITAITDIQGVLDVCRRQANPLLLIATDISNDVLTALVAINKKGTNKLVATKAPSFGDRQLELMTDIAILTGATVVGVNQDIDLKDVTSDQLGGCGKVKSTSASTTIIDGYGDDDALEARLDELRDQLKNADSDYVKELAQDRLARLTGGIAIVHVGGKTEVELIERKHRVEDALNATRAAIEEGIVPGGGAELVRTASKIYADPNALPGVKAGIDALKTAMNFPMLKIARNAGKNGEGIIEKLLEQDNDYYGYDAKNDQFGDLMEIGVIDPAKVTIAALSNACSVASVFLTTECAIVDASAVSHFQNAPDFSDMGIM